MQWTRHFWEVRQHLFDRRAQHQLRCTPAVYWNQQNSPLSKQRNCDASQKKLIWITALCINFFNDSSQWESKSVYGNTPTDRILLGSTHGTWNTHNYLPDCSPSRFKRLCLPCLSVAYNRWHFFHEQHPCWTVGGEVHGSWINIVLP